MIIKGDSVAGAARLATHLLRTDTNERVDVREIKGVVADNVRGALKEMEAVSVGARTTKPFYHASINTRPHERLSNDELSHAVDRLEEVLGLEGQPRIVVAHVKHGREHFHIGWSRIDLDRMAAISDSHNFRKHEQVARQLEREFGHERVQGAHVEREGKKRPERTPSHQEMLQAQRTGVDPREAKAFMTHIWRSTSSGEAFREELGKHGWAMAKGDRRDFVALDPQGGIHSIARRIDGARIADVRKRFADLDPQQMPSIVQARRRQNGEHARERKGYTRTPSDYQPDKEGRLLGARPSPRKVVQHNTARVVGGVADSLFSSLMGEKRVRKKEPPPSILNQPNAEAQRRQQLMRQLSREITPESQRDAEIEIDKSRERTRGR